MTPDHLTAIQAFAKGPLDGYTIHTAQQAIPALLVELERLRGENATLTAKVEDLTRTFEQPPPDSAQRSRMVSTLPTGATGPCG